PEAPSLTPCRTRHAPCTEGRTRGLLPSAPLHRGAMLTRHDVLRLSRRPAGEHPVLSVFLDTSVNEVNQRTYRLFLDKERAKHSELDSDRAGHHREALGEAFERIETWLAESFDESNKGVALYTEIGGEWLDALQFPVPVRNRIVISNRPVI